MQLFNIANMPFKMPSLSKRISVGRSVVAVLVICTVLILLRTIRIARIPRAHLDGKDWLLSQAYQDYRSFNRTLGVAAKIFVPSLTRRDDRRVNITHIGNSLDLDITFIPAIDARDPIIHNILSHVHLQRSKESHSAFAWPSTSSLSAIPQHLNWTTAVTPSLDPAQLANETCNTGDDTSVAFRAGLRDHQLLSPGKIACWETHLRILRMISNMSGSIPWNEMKLDQVPPIIRPADVTIIFEDDIDVEVDLRDRLAALWPMLPQSWDMVFLGHCWSNEAYNWPLAVYSPSGRSGNNETTLRDSHLPQCTHAYAVSIPGAHRLLASLEYAPFAYSRAIDQAYMWLIQIGRIRAFSLVPAVAIQRKLDSSDIFQVGTEHKWNEALYNGVFGS